MGIKECTTLKQIIITVLVVVGIVVGAVALSGGDEQTAGAVSNNFYGQESGVITLTEYGDFECPACAGFFPIVTQVKEDFKDQIRFEFRHFPLVQIHPNATAAHRAAEAAAKQGQFWEMHDLLYERQQAWRSNGSAVASSPPISSNNPTEIFEGYAEELGLDMDQYREDARSSDTLGTINADIELGKDNNVTSTPTFFIDSELVEDLNAISTVEGFSEVIQAAIDAKNAESGDATESTEATTEETARPEEEQ